MDKPRPECARCAHLSSCKEVTEKKIIDHHYCRLFKAAEQGVLGARADIIRECGLWALRYELPQRKLLSAKPKARRRKRHV
jgi:hypothetical protein